MRREERPTEPQCAPRYVVISMFALDRAYRPGGMGDVHNGQLLRVIDAAKTSDKMLDIESFKVMEMSIDS